MAPAALLSAKAGPVGLAGARSSFHQGCLQRAACAPRVGARDLKTIVRSASTDAEADPEIDVEALMAENAKLKAMLAKVQGVPVEEFSMDTFELKPAETTEEVEELEQTLLLADSETLMEQLRAGIKWATPTESPPFWERPLREKPMSLGGSDDEEETPKDGRSLHIVHMTAEMAPCAKVGGLGDVVTGLARESQARGHNVEICLPYYECLPESELVDLQQVDEFHCPKGRCWDGRYEQGSLLTRVFTAKIDGCNVILLRPDWNDSNIFRGGRIYGGSYNETEAYLYFSRACLEFLLRSGRQPHVLHLHEWQTSAAAMLYWEKMHGEGLGKPRLMLTIHNMDNSGEVRQDEFAVTGMPGEQFAHIDKALDERTIGHNPERLNLMKGGIIYSNAVTTVSPTYATESLNGGAAGWLRETLQKPENASKFHGVLNGIDTHLWDPRVDNLIPAAYSSEMMGGKALCKEFLQKGLGMDVDPAKPLVVCITRLVPQKGIHLIRHSIFKTNEMGGQYVLLGSGHCDGDFHGLAENDFKDNPNVQLKIMYSEALAHCMYAAADIVLVPSMFEPCGLTQMIALRYGAVPVVRKTGGLADTVFDVDEAGSDGNGYVFEGADEGSLDHALTRAFKMMEEKPKEWAALQAANMECDVSWGKSAQSYIELYNNIAVDY